MSVESSVRWFTSAMTGAPTSQGQLGSLIALLDAGLLNGFNTKTLTSLTRSGSTATATVSGGHGFTDSVVVRIAGAAQADYNGDHRITVVNSTTFTYTVANSPVTPATGTITAKVAPLDWSKVFSGTNKAVYRAPSTQGTRFYLRLDHSQDGRYCYARAYESMTDVDTGTNPYPTTTQSSNSCWMPSGSYDTTVRSWALVGDDRRLLLLCNYSGNNNMYPYFFGDFTSRVAGDAYASAMTYCEPAGSNYFGYLADATQKVIARATDQVTLSPIFYTHGYPYQTYIGNGGANYPNPQDQGLILVGPMILIETGGVRGMLPFVYAPWHTNQTLTHFKLYGDVAELPGRKFLCSFISAYVSSGSVLLDVTGPW